MSAAPKDIARSFPRIQEMFMKSNKKLLKSERDKIKETEGINNCTVCREQKDGNKRCSGCYMVFYCGRDCQAKDWDNHKDKCKIIQKEYKLWYISYTIGDLLKLGEQTYKFTNKWIFFILFPLYSYCKLHCKFLALNSNLQILLYFASLTFQIL